MNVLQVEALCWCGKRATHNARTENGEMVTEGEVIVVGDVEDGRRAAGRGRLRGALPPHHRRRHDRRPGPRHLDGRRAAAVRLSAQVPRSPGTCATGDALPASGRRRRADCRSADQDRDHASRAAVSEPCRPIRVIS